MDEQQTHSQLRQFARLFLPSGAEFGIYLLLSLALLLIATLTAARTWLGISGEQAEIGKLLPNNLTGLLDSIRSSSLLPTVATAFFWAGVGGIVYILLWLFGNLWIAIRNDIVVIENFIKPSHSGAVPGARYELLESLSLRLAGLAGLLGFSILALPLLFPLYASMFRGAVLHWHNLSYLVNGLAGLLGMSILMHIYVVLIRLLLLRVRIFS